MLKGLQHFCKCHKRTPESDRHTNVPSNFEQCCEMGTVSHYESPLFLFPFPFIYMSIYINRFNYPSLRNIDSILLLRLHYYIPSQNTMEPTDASIGHQLKGNGRSPQSGIRTYPIKDAAITLHWAVGRRCAADAGDDSDVTWASMTGAEVEISIPMMKCTDSSSVAQAEVKKSRLSKRPVLQTHNLI